MKFRHPTMTYLPRNMEDWEKHISLTIVPAPFEKIAPVAAGIFKVRDVAIGAKSGERMPPLMWESEMHRRHEAGEKRAGDPSGFGNFGAMLIWAPPEAANFTVIEHPLDMVGTAGFPEDLARVLPDIKLTTFDSIMETAGRQTHAMKISKGRTVLRRVVSTIGFDEHRWEWTEEGAPEDFENCQHYKAKSISARLNRTIIMDYIKAFGIDLNKSMFGRTFQQSLLLWRLDAAEPSTAEFYCKDYDSEAAKARSCGVQCRYPDDITELVVEDNFADTAIGIADMRRWEQLLNTTQWKASQSADRAKTDAGRLRAQWRVVEVVQQIQEEAVAAGLAPVVVRGIAKRNGLSRVMKELGKDTEAYSHFLDCYKK